MNQPSKFRTRNWAEINGESQGSYNKDNIKFKTLMKRSNLCDYSDAYIRLKATVTVSNTEGASSVPNNINIKVIF